MLMKKLIEEGQQDGLSSKGPVFLPPSLATCSDLESGWRTKVSLMPVSMILWKKELVKQNWFHP